MAAPYDGWLKSFAMKGAISSSQFLITGGREMLRRLWRTLSQWRQEPGRDQRRNIVFPEAEED